MFATTGTIPQLEVGGERFTSPSTVIIGRAYSTTAARLKATFAQDTGSAGYQVPTGFKLRVKAIQVLALAAGTARINLAQTDNDVGQDSNTAFTNAVYLAGAAAHYPFFVPVTTGNYDARPCNFTVAAGKYLSMEVNSSLACAVTIFGELEGT